MKSYHIIAVASVVLLAAGCAEEQRQAQYNSPTYPAGADMGSQNMAGSMSSGAFVTRPVTSDRLVEANVRQSLLRDLEIAPLVQNIQITANNGAVMLTGMVQSDQQVRQVGAIALGTTGVIAVNNQLHAMASGTGMQNPSVPGNPLSPTSTDPNAPSRIYHEPDSDNNSTDLINPASRPDEGNKIYQETVPGLDTNTDDMH